MSWLQNIRELQLECWAVSESKGFHETPATFDTRIALIHTEVSEAFEAYRDGNPVNFMWLEGEDEKPEGVPSELADVVIRVLDLCQIHDIDLADAIEKKVAYNRTRPFMHGKAF